MRTLAASHPAYHPYGYHRGAVWPVEHGPFALGLRRYGLREDMLAICRAQFDLVRLFEGYRLPECVAGHPRDELHPFPALYPAANSPQAWSAATPLALLQAMLGMGAAGVGWQALGGSLVARMASRNPRTGSARGKRTRGFAVLARWR